MGAHVCRLCSTYSLFEEELWLLGDLGKDNVLRRVKTKRLPLLQPLQLLLGYHVLGIIARTGTGLP